MKNKKIILHRLIPTLILTFFIIPLLACSRQDNLSHIFNEWLLVEKSELSLSNFIEEYKSFTATPVYENMKLSDTYSEYIKELEKAVQTQDEELIRIALLNLEQLDKSVTFKSNQKYILLAELLFVLSFITSIFLILTFKNYEKKRNEAKQMGIYSRFMIKGIETERARISKEIHDTVLQDIKALSLKYELIDSKDNSQLKKELLSQTDFCIKALRSICNNLTPVELKNHNDNEMGFILSVRNLTSQFTERTKIPCILKIPESLDIKSLTTLKSVNIFRIIQEALNNIEKHAEAGMTSVIITNGKNSDGQNCLKVYITDDGKGFDSKSILKNAATNHGHFGLLNMKERAKDSGGELYFVSNPGEGTEIKLEVPLK